jgi:hypothetical protein
MKRDRSEAEVRTVKAMQSEYRKLRSAAHANERAEFERLSRDPTFRHFLALCISERAASDIGPVEIRSADPEVATLAAHWLRRLSNGRVDYRLQFDEGADVVELVRFWTVRLGVSQDKIRLQRWFHDRSEAPRRGKAPHGVITVRSSNADLRIRLHGWMQRIREEGFPDVEQEELFDVQAV